jgi:hypothetical protein
VAGKRILELRSSTYSTFDLVQVAIRIFVRTLIVVCDAARGCCCGTSLSFRPAAQSLGENAQPERSHPTPTIASSTAPLFHFPTLYRFDQVPTGCTCGAGGTSELEEVAAILDSSYHIQVESC